VHPVGAEHERVLAGLAEAAGAGRAGFRDFRPHLTVAWGRPGRPDPTGLAQAFDDYSGPEFTASDVVLMRSEPGPSGPAYVPVDRVSLDTSGPVDGAPG
jgi:2'-5' RNA ligase